MTPNNNLPNKENLTNKIERQQGGEDTEEKYDCPQKFC